MSKWVKIIFSVWVIIWIFFFVRTLLRQGYLRRYYELIGKSLEERRSYVYGKDLYDFLNYCQENLPVSSTHRLIGLEVDSVDYVRAAYYLYPHLKNENPRFILIYRLKNFKEVGYSLFSSMNEKNFILRRN